MWLGEKNKVYGYKVKASVFLKYLKFECSRYYAGRVSDSEIFQKMRQFHIRELRKAKIEHYVEENRNLSTEYPDMWSCIVYKGWISGYC